MIWLFRVGRISLPGGSVTLEEILWRLRVDELEAQFALCKIERAGPTFEISSPHISLERKA
jgi:hypothetical protein